MKYIFVIICSIILPIFSLKNIKHKLCINCKYFITDNNNNDKFGKCTLFPRKENDNFFLVTGITEDKIIEYHYCSVSRESNNMCGKEGNMFKKKYKKRLS